MESGPVWSFLEILEGSASSSASPLPTPFPQLAHMQVFSHSLTLLKKKKFRNICFYRENFPCSCNECGAVSSITLRGPWPSC